MNEASRWTSPTTPTWGAGVPEARRIAWIDGVKALALLWIALVHWTEQVFGFGYFANPNNHWPPLAERLDQLRPLHDHGLWNLPLSLLRLVGWMGDGGVQLFLIASGFGLAYVTLQRRQPMAWGAFVRRRLARVYPTWWVAHLGLLLAGLILPVAITPASDIFWLSALGFRASLSTLYAFCPAWWFIGLILQLYAVYPLLHAALRRWGAGRFAVGIVGSALLVRGIGLWLFAGPFADWQYLDAWSRGAVFVTRLPEFAAGMLLAYAYAAEASRTDAAVRSPAVLAGAAVTAAIGFGLSFFLLGNALAFLLFGAGAFVLAGVLARPLMASAMTGAVLAWLSRHSLSLFLTHQLAIEALVPAGARIGGGLWMRTAAALATTVIATLALEALVRGLGWLVGAARARARVRWGGRGMALRFGLAALGVYALLLAAEVYSRQIAPQEVAGWGERPSLTPDPRFGWTLIPSQTTRLRWQTYDYRVDANALGFPGPAYPEDKPTGGLRILTTGDAFTSAEGVDTGEAWPRLLEAGLRHAHPNRPVQVMNFAITGYGPNQYAAAVQAFVPRFKPDLVIVEFFVNDLDDVEIQTQQFQKQIGFGRPLPDGLFATLTLGNLYALARRGVRVLVFEHILGRPHSRESFLAMLPEFAAATDAKQRTADAAIETDLQAAIGRIKATTDAAHSRLIALLVPAGIQVCSPEQLPYYPRTADLSDAKRFDLERPQRLLSQATAAFGIETYDLRSVLRAAPGGCPYQPHNLHWLAAGHAAVATFAASLLTSSPSSAP